MGASLSLSGCIHSFYNHSLIHSVIYAVTHSLPHSFIHAVTYSFPLSFIHAVTQSFTHSLTHSFTHSLILQKSLGGCRSWPVLQNVSFPQPLSLYYKGQLHFDFVRFGQNCTFLSLSSVPSHLTHLVTPLCRSVCWVTVGRLETPGSNTLFSFKIVPPSGFSSLKMQEIRLLGICYIYLFTH